MEQVVKIEGMKCDGCANTVKTKLGTLSQVQTADVDLAANEATLTVDETINIDTLNEALKDTNYSVVA